MNNSYDLVPLKNAILDIYRMFSEICERHGLQYFVAFGTALGAVRHKGFIPWDDDFDIMMPRPDYEKFVRILPSEEYKFLKFINWNTAVPFG